MSDLDDGAVTLREEPPESGQKAADEELNLNALRGARRWTVLALAIAFIALLGAMASSEAWIDVVPTEPPAIVERYTAVPGPSPTRTATATATASATPTMTPTTTPTPTPAYVEYTVVRGDTLLTIALQFDTSVDILSSVNAVTENDVLSIGQVLRIPVSGEVPAPTATPEPTATLAATAAATVAPATAQPEPQQVIHTVASGEHIGIIALRYGVSQAAIAAANDIDVGGILSVGQKLVIPTEGTLPSQKIHTVVAGENLLIIAQAYGLTQQELASANGISLNSILSIGQELTIPTKGSAPAPITHTVVAGENLLIIAQAYGLSQQEIASANGITLNSILSIGQELVIPVAANQGGAQPTATAAPPTPQPEQTPTSTPERLTVHTVASGEFIEAIATRYGVSVNKILEANDLSSESILSVGQEIIIPAEGISATPMPEAMATAPVALPTVTPLPTLTPAPDDPVDYVYPRPYLLSPASGATFSGADAAIVLNWTSSGILAPHEWYLVRIWLSKFDRDTVEIWTRATSTRLSTDLMPAAGEAEQLLWQVTVVSRYGTAETGTPLSPTSASRIINWR